MSKWGFHPDAKQEFRAAVQWHESNKPGLGTEFRQEIEAAISRILADPESFVHVESDVQFVSVHRFPYGIFYRSRPERIVIVAVMHLHREPDYWKSRIA